MFLIKILIEYLYFQVGLSDHSAQILCQIKDLRSEQGDQNNRSDHSAQILCQIKDLRSEQGDQNNRSDHGSDFVADQRSEI